MSKRSRRLLSVLTAILLFFSNFSGLVVKAEENGDVIEDTTPPELHSVTVDKQEANPGDKVTVRVDASDENSGVKDVIVTYQNEYLGTMEAVGAYNEESGNYEAVFSIDENTGPGKWIVPYIIVTDLKDNDQTYWADDNNNFDHLAFNVKNDSYNDVTAPVVHSISVDKQEVNYGEEVTVSLDVTDDLSEINTVSVQFEGENYGYMWKEAVYNKDNQKFEAKLPISYSTPTGKWRATYVSVDDKRNNWNGYYEGGDLDLSKAQFTVLEGNKDDTPPVVDGVTVDKQEAKPGETVTVSVDAKDDKSGIDTIYVNYRGSNGGYLSKQAVLNDESNKYEAQIAIEDTTKSGTWSIATIQLYDKAANQVEFYNGDDADFSSGNFTVINENSDTTAPTIQDVTVDKKDAKPGDTVTVSIDAADDKSEITYLEVNYYGPIGDMSEEAVYNPDTQKYEAKLLISEDTRPGTWTLSSIFIEDSEYNYKNISRDEMPDLSTGDFNVINENADITPPTIKGVTVDKTEARPGDIVTVSIDAVDDQSEINYLSVTYQTGKNRYTSQGAVYNPETGKYDAKFSIDDDSPSGKWSIYSIYASDSVYNGGYIYNGEEQDLSSGDFSVINENADMTAPTVQSVSVDKNEAQPGDEVKVIVEAVDEKSGIKQVYMSLDGSKGGYLWQDAVYNPDTKRYEATFLITETTKPGTWGISHIGVIDNAGNENSLNSDDFDFSPSEFTVINPNADMTPPKVNSVTVDKKEAHPGDKVKVILDVTDDKSGVEAVYVYLFGSSGGSYWQEAVLNSETNKYEIMFVVNETTRPGTWKISSITVRDKEDNGNYYPNGEEHLDLSPADFTVVNESIDITPPALKSVSVDKKEVKPGEEVTVSIEATDNQSGVQVISLVYRNEEGRTQSAAAVYNQKTKQFEAKLPITETSRPGVWSLDEVYLEDTEGNGVTLYQGEDFNISEADFTVVNINIDVAAPVVKAISVNKQEVNAPGQVTVTIEAEDDKTGVQDVTVIYNLPNQSEKSVQALLNPSTGKYEAVIDLGQYAAAGLWVVQRIELSDKEGNSREVYNQGLIPYPGLELMDLSGGSFKVINPNEDITSPVVNSISVNKDQFNAGETVKIELDVTDSQSGVSDVDINVYATNGGYLSGIASYNEKTHKYEALLPIHDYTKSGKWTVGSIQVRDNEGNEDYLFSREYDFSRANFNVTTTMDTTPPIVHDVSVDKKEAKSGEEVTISVNVSDAESSVKDVQIGFSSNNGGYYWDLAVYNETTKKYEVKFPITKETKAGNWTIYNIYVSDSVENGDSYNSYNPRDLDLSNADFTVIKDGADVTLPIFQGITVDKKEAKPGDVVTLSIAASDAHSGISEVSIVFEDSHENIPAEYNAVTDKYELQIPITETTKPGTRKVSSLTIRDKEGNELYVESGNGIDFSAADYTVKNDSVDGKAPVIHSVSVDKKSAKPGETVTLSLDITDDKSGVEYIVVEYTDINGNLFWRFATYNEKTGKYEVKIRITPLFKTGFWGIYAIYAYDKAENSQILFNDGKNDLSAGDFSVNNKNLDTTAPVAPSVDEVTDQSKIVSGTTEPRVKVIVKAGEKEVGTASADSKGKFAVSISPQKANTNLTIIAVDSSENASPATTVVVKDVTAPLAPVVNSVTDQAKVVTGKTEAGAIVTVKIGTAKYTAVKPADANGNFTVTIPQQKAKTVLSVTAMDSAKLVSPERAVTVVDKTAPSMPTVNTVTDKSKEVSGIAEAGATVTVTIGTKKYTAEKPADSKGSYKVTIPQQKAGVKISVTAIDAAKNGSSARVVTVLDKTAPSLPTVNAVSDKTKEVSGKTEAGATATVAIGTKKYTSKPADAKGYYKVTIPVQKAGTKVYVTVKDKAGNVSASKYTVVLDKTAPGAPTVKTKVKSTTKEVTGTAEAYAAITIKVGKTVIGSGTADKKGSYKVKIKAQKKKIVLSVTATDKAKNISSSTTVKVN
jgi:hypothetical protein